MSGPLGGRMCCDREVNNGPTLMRQHQEHIQNLKANRRHGEEIYGDKALQMIVQERAPGLRRWLSASDQVLAHARLADIECQSSGVRRECVVLPSLDSRGSCGGSV